MSHPLSRRSQNALALLLLAACLLAALYRIWGWTLGSPGELQWGAYGFSELIIDYRGGFIRRGLLGALVHHAMGGTSSLPPLNQLLFANYALLCALLLGLAALSQRSLVAALLVFLLPGGLFSMALTREFFFRKEMLFYSALALVALAVHLGRRTRSAPVRRGLQALALALLAVFAVALPLVHEGFLFLAAPASAALLFAALNGASGSRAGAGSAASPLAKPLAGRIAQGYLALEVLAFAALSLFKGSDAAARAMWSHLSAADRLLVSPSGELSGAPASLAWTFWQGLELPKGVLMSGLAWYWATPAVLGALSCLALAAWFAPDARAPRGAADPAPAAQPERPMQREPLDSSQAATLARTYLALTVCALPLFALGWDWGRWLVSIELSFVLLWLALDAELLRAFARAVLPARALASPAAQRRAGQLDALAEQFFAFVQRHRRAALASLLLLAFTLRIPEARLEAGTGTWAPSRLGTGLKDAARKLRGG